MILKTFLTLLAFSFTCIFAEGEAATSVPATETVGGFVFQGKQLESKYLKTFKNWAERDLEQGNVPAGEKILCVGSSSMRMWKSIHEDLAPLEVLHRGFGGSTMSQVLVFEDFFARYKASTIMVYEGDNDLMGKMTPEKYLLECKQFVATMQAANPEAEIFFLPAKPSPSRWEKWPKFTRSNELLKEYCDATEGLTYIDIASPMLGDDGKPLPDIFLGDNLHMNKKGYEIWTKTIRAALKLPPE